MKLIAVFAKLKEAAWIDTYEEEINWKKILEENERIQLKISAKI